MRRLLWALVSIGSPGALGACGDDASGLEVHVTSIGNSGIEPLSGFQTCTADIAIYSGLPKAKHVLPCTPVSYAENPPAFGDHWPVWADYTTYEQPVPRELYVHDLEHGGVVVAYNCDGCDKAIAELADLVAATAPSALCAADGLPAQIVMTPDPLLERPIAVMAWGATWSGTCVIPESIRSFIDTHIGHGTESTCAPGIDPATIICRAP